MIAVRIILVSLALVGSQSVIGAIEQREFSDPALADRYDGLIAELRCLVCQNQNLADSNADLAKDLRTKTARMLEAGESDQYILQYMSDRYGDFVLYRPPFRWDTALLWLGPLALLVIVIFVLTRNLRRRRQEEILQTTLNDDENLQVKRLKVRNLMKNTLPMD